VRLLSKTRAYVAGAAALARALTLASTDSSRSCTGASFRRCCTTRVAVDARAGRAGRQLRDRAMLVGALGAGTVTDVIGRNRRASSRRLGPRARTAALRSAEFMRSVESTLTATAASTHREPDEDR
jgi:hypothetical protein